MRTIIEDERFAREREALDPNWSRMDEVLDGVREVLARAPYLGTRITKDVWAIGTTFHEPSFLIYYRFDSTSVTLLSIRRQDENGERGL